LIARHGPLWFEKSQRASGELRSETASPWPHYSSDAPRMPKAARRRFYLPGMKKLPHTRRFQFGRPARSGSL
jgi:hypothetical protein